MNQKLIPQRAILLEHQNRLATRADACAGIRRDAFRRPLFERGDERVVREIFGGADVARDAREAGDEIDRAIFQAMPQRAPGSTELCTIRW